MDFNKLYKTIADLDKPRQVLKENQQPIEECGMMGMSPLGGIDDRPTTMSVNMNASGAEGIRELLNILQGKGDDGISSPDGPDGGPAGILIGMDGPDDHDMHSHGDSPDGGKMSPLSKSPADDFLDPDIDEEYENSPDESMVAGVDRMGGFDGSGEGIDKPKASFPPARNPADPPMHESLYKKLSNLYKEVKTR